MVRAVVTVTVVVLLLVLYGVALATLARRLTTRDRRSTGLKGLFARFVGVQDDLVGGVVDRIGSWLHPSDGELAERGKVAALSRRLQRSLGPRGEPQTAATQLALLSTLKGPPAAGAVLPALGHGDPKVRRAAVDALGRIAERSATEALAGLLGREKDPGVLGAAVDALGRIGDPRAFDAVAGALASPLLARRAEAALVGLAPSDAASVEALLRHPERVVRVAAVRSLGKVPGLDPADLLVETVRRDASAEVREEAAAVLGRLGEPAFGPLEQLASSSARTDREGAVAGLAAMPHCTPAWRLLERVADTDPEAPVRIAAGAVLAGKGASRRMPQVLEAAAAGGEAAEVVRTALRRLGNEAWDSLLDYAKLEGEPLGSRQTALAILAGVPPGEEGWKGRGMRQKRESLLRVLLWDAALAPHAATALGALGVPFSRCAGCSTWVEARLTAYCSACQERNQDAAHARQRGR